MRYDIYKEKKNRKIFMMITNYLEEGRLRLEITFIGLRHSTHELTQIENKLLL
jgi:hypothetical protein